MPRGSTCKARGCAANKNDNPELSFHSFPRNKERFKLWCELIKRPDLNHEKAITSRMSMRVCSLHFENRMYMSPTSKTRLIWCALPMPVEIKVPETKEAALVTSLLPKPEASDKMDVLSSYAEDIIIKEESDVDRDTNTDISVPSYCSRGSSPMVFFADTKVGILEQSQAGPCVEERVESKSFQDVPQSCQTSCSAKTNTVGCMTQSSSQQESMSPESPIRLLNSILDTQLNTTSEDVAVSQESSSNQSKPSKPDSTGFYIDEAVSMNEDLCEKSTANMENTFEIGKSGCSEGCRSDKCFAAEETDKRTGATKSSPRRTYPGPIRRQVVRTSSGDKKTIMIVNKASLKNLQARGLIKPIRKYMTKHPNAVQSLKNTTQYSSVSSDNPSRLSQSEDLLPLKEADTSRRSSSIPTTQPATDEHCDNESCSESRHELHASSHTSQTPKLQPPNQDSQAPVTVSWAPVNGSNALSFTFTVTLPTGVATPPGTSLDALQIATSLLNNSANCTVNPPNSQARDNFDSNQMPNKQSPNNSVISSELRTKASNESLSIHSTTSALTSLDPLQINASTVSTKYGLLSPVVRTHNPLFGCETSSVCKELTHKTKCPSGKQTDIDYDCCSSMNTSSMKNPSTASLTHKHPTPHSLYVTTPGLSSEASSVKKIAHYSKGLKESKENQPTKTRPQNTESVQWIALPTVPVRQPKSSSCGTSEQVHQAGFIRKCQLSNTTLHSSEQFSAVYGAPPMTSREQQGKKLHLPPPYRSPNKDLKRRYGRLLNRHRHRYYLLMKRYKFLEEKYSAVKDVGTPQQIIIDAKKFLSEEHILFLESQMFLRNRPGTGNRFSRKFMKLMIEYYKRSAAGYRYLRTIFTIPSVKTIQKWLKKPFECRDFSEGALEDSKEDSESGSDDELFLPQKRKHDICQDSKSYVNFSQSKVPVLNLEYEDNSLDDYDSEESGLEEMEYENEHRR